MCNNIGRRTKIINRLECEGKCKDSSKGAYLYSIEFDWWSLEKGFWYNYYYRIMYEARKQVSKEIPNKLDLSKVVCVYLMDERK